MWQQIDIEIIDIAGKEIFRSDLNISPYLPFTITYSLAPSFLMALQFAQFYLPNLLHPFNKLSPPYEPLP